MIWQEWVFRWVPVTFYLLAGIFFIYWGWRQRKEIERFQVVTRKCEEYTEALRIEVSKTQDALRRMQSQTKIAAQNAEYLSQERDRWVRNREQIEQRISQAIEAALAEKNRNGVNADE